MKYSVRQNPASFRFANTLSLSLIIVTRVMIRQVPIGSNLLNNPLHVFRGMNKKEGRSLAKAQRAPRRISPWVIEHQIPVNLRALRGIDFSPPLSPEALSSSLFLRDLGGGKILFYRKDLKETQIERSQHHPQQQVFFLCARNKSEIYFCHKMHKSHKKQTGHENVTWRFESGRISSDQFLIRNS